MYVNVMIVRRGGRRQKRPFPICSLDTWYDLKMQIASEIGKTPDSLLLTFHDRPVNDHDNVLNCVPCNFATVLCTVHRNTFITGRGFPACTGCTACGGGTGRPLPPPRDASGIYGGAPPPSWASGRDREKGGFAQHRWYTVKKSKKKKKLRCC